MFRSSTEPDNRKVGPMRPPAPHLPAINPPAEPEEDTTSVALYGSPEACATAKRLIEELFAKAAEARREAHARTREREKEKRAANRKLYMLRHAADYHILGVEVGTKKDDIKKAYRKLAVIWHPGAWLFVAPRS